MSLDSAPSSSVHFSGASLTASELARRSAARLVAFATQLLGEPALSAAAVERALAGLATGRKDSGTIEPRELQRRIVVEARARLTRPPPWDALASLLPSFSAHGAHLTPPLPVHPSSDPARQRAATCRCMAALPDLHRAVLLLCDGEGVSVAECAEWLALATPDVRRLRHEARLALLTLLARDELVHCA
jgi:DNA-directed RNA polymerase specialized sigma24 family protein